MQNKRQEKEIYKSGRFSIWKTMQKKTDIREKLRKSKILTGESAARSEPVQKLIDATLFCCNGKIYAGYKITLDVILADIIVKFAESFSWRLGKRPDVRKDVKAKLDPGIMDLGARLDVKEIDERFRARQAEVGVGAISQRHFEKMKWIIIMKWLGQFLRRKDERIDKLIELIYDFILDFLNDHAKKAWKEENLDGQQAEMITIDDDDAPRRRHDTSTVANRRAERAEKRNKIMKIAARIREQMSELIEKNPSIIDVILTEKQKKKAGEKTVEAAIFRIIKRGRPALTPFLEEDEFTVVQLVEIILKHILVYPMLIPNRQTIKLHLASVLAADQTVERNKVTANMNIFVAGEHEGLWTAGLCAIFPDSCVESVMALHESMLKMIVERLRASHPKPDPLKRAQHDSESEEDPDEQGRREHGVPRGQVDLPPDDEEGDRRRRRMEERRRRPFQVPGPSSQSNDEGVSRPW